MSSGDLSSMATTSKRSAQEGSTSERRSISGGKDFDDLNTGITMLRSTEALPGMDQSIPGAFVGNLTV